MSKKDKRSTRRRSTIDFVDVENNQSTNKFLAKEESRRLTRRGTAVKDMQPASLLDVDASLMRWLTPLSMKSHNSKMRILKDRQGLGYVRLEKGQSFPSTKELHLLPEEMQATMREVALGVLQFRLGPVIAVYMRRRAKATMLKELQTTVREAQSSPSASVLSTLMCFSKWDSLNAVSAAFVPRVYVEGDLVIHQGENEHSGLFYLAHGTAREEMSEADENGRSAVALSVLSGSFSPSAGSPTKRHNQLPPTTQSFGPGMILGDCTLSTLHPQRHHIKITSKEAVVFVLSLAKYRTMLQDQSPEVQQHVRDESSQHRVNSMRQYYPQTVESLKKSNYFAKLSDDSVTVAVEKLQPKVYHKGQMLYKAGELATSLFILVRGKLTLKSTNTKAVPITVKAPCIVGDVSWMQLVKRSKTCVAASSCSVYVLTKDHMKSTLAAEDVPTLLSGEAASPQRGESFRRRSVVRDATNFLRYIPYVRSIPILSMYLPDLDDPSEPLFPLLQDLAEAFTSKVFTPKSTITSATQECDNMYVILSGNAVAQVENSKKGVVKNVALKHNEPIGYTMLVAHRWAHRVVSVDSVETLVMHVDTYRRILRKYHLLEKVSHRVTALLFPEAVSEQEARDAMTDISHLKNPMLFPRSRSFEVETVCRYPSEAKLQKLKPIRMKSQLSTCVYSRHSMSRISNEELPAANMLNPDGSIRPMVLGKHNKVTMGYKQKPQLEPS